jgi:hypothetical protein
VKRRCAIGARFTALAVKQNFGEFDYERRVDFVQQEGVFVAFVRAASVADIFTLVLFAAASIAVTFFVAAIALVFIIVVGDEWASHH